MIHHYLLTCLSYMGARQRLRAKLRRGASSISFLIGTRIGIPHLLRYIGDTKRFMATLGDVQPDNDFKLKKKEIKGKSRRRRENGDDD